MRRSEPAVSKQSDVEPRADVTNLVIRGIHDKRTLSGSNVEEGRAPQEGDAPFSGDESKALYRELPKRGVGHRPHCIKEA